MPISNHPSFRRRRGARFRAAIVCSTAVALFAFSSAPAYADELSELKAQLEALQKRIEQLEAKQQAAAEVPPAPAKAVSSGNDNIQLAVSGQVNRAALFVDRHPRPKIFCSQSVIGRRKVENLQNDPCAYSRERRETVGSIPQMPGHPVIGKMRS